MTVAPYETVAPLGSVLTEMILLLNVMAGMMGKFMSGSGAIPYERIPGLA